MSRFGIATGLALLYASAYFLSFLNPSRLYFLPSFFDYIFYPSLVTVACLTPVFLLATSRLIGERIKRHLVFFGTGILTIIAIKSAFQAADYPWVNILPLLMSSSVPSSSELRFVKIVLVSGSIAAVFLLMYLMRKNLSKWRQWLSTLGYAFALLAVYRSVALDLFSQSPIMPPAVVVDRATPIMARRVVWVIFDEMDYELSLNQGQSTRLTMPNFSALTDRAISASAAFSPGKDTLYSVPALLTGTALSGYTRGPKNTLELIDEQKKIVAFSMENAIFSQLPGGPQSATVLGFYHPYCKIFPTLQFCDATYLDEAGRWFDSLLFFSAPTVSTMESFEWVASILPDFILYQFDHMYRVSVNLLSHLDHILANQHSSLDFIHVNLPHLPDSYMRRLKNQPKLSDVEAYKQNLSGADLILGRIVKDLELNSGKQNILLLVSSDHWLRSHSSQPAPVPFIIWKVGADEPIVLSERISTMHSKQLALDFLAGKLDTQSELADALRRTTYHPTWSAPDGYK